jgi:hypothetical protein
MGVVSRDDFIALAVLTAIAVAAVIYAVIGTRLLPPRPSDPEPRERS